MNRDSTLIACHDCDLLQRQIALPPGGIAACGRCGAVLYRKNVNSNETTLALTIAALMVFAISNLFPIVGIETQGHHHASTLFGAVTTLWNDQMRLVAILVFMTTMLMPALELMAMVFLLASAKPTPLALRLVMAISPWAMVEVFMLGLLVSVQKLSHLATIIPGVALWSFAILMVLFAAITARFNVNSLWQQAVFEHSYASH